MKHDITFTVNDEPYGLTVQSHHTLLHVLREQLVLTGTKNGCSEGECGACTVHVDGVAMRSCGVTVGEVAGKDITTIEGLAAGGVMHKVQLAWIASDVPQCGYCQPGQIMSATALLNATPKPADADIDAAMSGNICRCATYVRIRAAISAYGSPQVGCRGLRRCHQLRGSRSAPSPGDTR